MTAHLKEALIQKQQLLDEPDARFAARLGMERSTWAHIRNGRPLPAKTAPIAVRAFPDLEDAYLCDIRGVEPRRRRRSVGGHTASVA